MEQETVAAAQDAESSALTKLPHELALSRLHAERPRIRSRAHVCIRARACSHLLNTLQGAVKRRGGREGHASSSLTQVLSSTCMAHAAMAVEDGRACISACLSVCQSVGRQGGPGAAASCISADVPWPGGGGRAWQGGGGGGARKPDVRPSWKGLEVVLGGQEVAGYGLGERVTEPCASISGEAKVYMKRGPRS